MRCSPPDRHGPAGAPAAAVCLLGALIALVGHAAAQLEPHAGRPATHRHGPAGLDAQGTVSLERLDGAWHFRFEGDEVVEYVVDPSHPDVAEGLLRVEEIAASGGALPLVEGGLSWRTSSTTIDDPVAHAAVTDTVLLDEFGCEDTVTLRLRYREDRGGTIAHKTYTFRLVGKVLRVRVQGTTEAGTWLDGYAGVWPGRVDGLDDVSEVRLPYMDGLTLLKGDPPPPGGSGGPNAVSPASTGGDPPVGPVGDSGGGILPDAGPMREAPPPDPMSRNVYASTFLDWYRSSGGRLASQGDGLLPGGGFQQWTAPVALPDENGAVLAPVDETINVLVTTRLEDAFVPPDTEPSPYRDLLAGRMVLQAADDRSNAWNAYALHAEALAGWGVTDVVGWVSEWSAWFPGALSPQLEVAQVLGCDPSQVTTTAVVFPLTSPPADWPSDIERVDPLDPLNVTLAHTTFASFMDAARSSGWILGLRQPSAHMDQQGIGPYLPGQTDYLTFLPYWEEGWLDGTVGLGLDVPAVNLAYDGTNVVRDESGVPKFGTDTTASVSGSLWDPTAYGAFPPQDGGHAMHVVSPAHRAAHYTSQLDTVAPLYGPGAAWIDDHVEVSDDELVDQQSGSDRSHAIWEALLEDAAAVAAQKRDLGGPLLGDAARRRWQQWDGFASGLWDGRVRAFADAWGPGDPVEGLDDSWVVPDYELSVVAPLVGGHFGMGRETTFQLPADIVAGKPGGCPDLLPLDCPDGTHSGFLDGWWTTLVTYGHSAFATTNGHRAEAWRSMEGLLREYLLVTGLQRVARQTPLASVDYLWRGQLIDLDTALAVGVDLRHPKVRVRYEGGLTLWANHDTLGGTDWTVVVPDVGAGGLATERTFVVPPDGFVASDGEGLLVFSADNPGVVPRHRIDYARVPGRWEMISTRGDGSQTFDGFPPASVLSSVFGPADAAFFGEATLARHDEANLWVGARGGLWDLDAGDWVPGTGRVRAEPAGPALPVQGLVVTGGGATTGVAVGREIGLTAALELGTTPDGEPIRRDATTLVDWSVDVPAVASVNGRGAVLGLSPGAVVVTASWPAGSTPQWTDSVGLTVTDGEPDAVIAGPVLALAGQAAVWDGAGSVDPEGGRLGLLWTFEDGTPARAGPAVKHTFRTPGNQLVTLAVTDRQGNEDVATRRVGVSGPPGLVWADGFDDGTLDAWSAVGAWGNGLGRARQLDGTASWATLSIEDAGWLDPTVAADVTLLPPFTPDGGAGLAVRKTGVDDPPTESGYSVALRPDGVVALVEGTGLALVTLATAAVGGFDPSATHRLELRVDQSGIPLVLRVSVDGTEHIAQPIGTPQEGERVGLVTSKQAARFDDVVVTVQ